MSVTAEHLDVPPAQYTGAAARAFARAVDDLTVPIPGARSCPASGVGAPPSRLTLELGTARGPVLVVVRADGCGFTSIAHGDRPVAANLDGGWALVDLARRLARPDGAARTPRTSSSRVDPGSLAAARCRNRAI